MKLHCYSVPDLDEFVVHSTFSLKKGHFKKNKLIHIKNTDGSRAPAQIEIIARHPDGSIKVAEIFGLVKRLDLIPGEPFDFEIGNGPAKIHNFQFSDDLLDIAIKTGGVKLRITDGFGRIYEAGLSAADEGASWKYHKSGAICMNLEVSSTAIATEEGTTGFPHLGGVSIFYNGFSNFDCADIGLIWHNGNVDEVIGDIYFEKVELILRGEWVCDSKRDGFAATQSETETVITLIDKLPNNKLHKLKQRGTLKRRFVVGQTKNNKFDFCLNRGDYCLIEDGWTNNQAFYSPTDIPLPKLGEEALAKVQDNFKSLLEKVNGEGGYLITHVGPYTMYDVAYGGKTGGEEINIFPAPLEAITSHPDGIHYLRLVDECYSDRHPNALYKSNGEPIILDDYIKADGGVPWNVFFSEFINNQDEPFNFKNAIQTYKAYAQENGLEADYVGEYDGYQPIHTSHLTRRLWSLLGLIWLDNDPMAKRQLAVEAELCRMSFFEGEGGRLHNFYEQAIEEPHKGLYVGRIEGWVLYTQAAMYAIADGEWRQRYDQNLNMWLETLYNGQYETGGISSINTSLAKVYKDPPFNSQYKVAQIFASIIIQTGARALLTNCLSSPSDRAKAREFIRGIGKWVWQYCWTPGGNGNYFTIAIGPTDDTQPLYEEEDLPSLPENAFYSPNSQYLTAAALAFAFDAGKGLPTAIEMLSAFQAYTGSYENPLEALQAEPLAQIEDRAFMLKILQALDDFNFKWTF